MVAQNKYRNWVRKNIFLIVVLLTFAIFRVLFIFLPEAANFIYRDNFYNLLRHLFALVNWIPFSIFWIFAGIISYFLYGTIRDKSLFKLLKITLVVYALFYLLWGFNYFANDIGDDFTKLNNRITSEDIIYHYNQVTNSVNQLSADETLPLTRNIKELQEAIKPNLENVLQYFGYKKVSGVQIKYLFPKGILLRWATSGFYWPYALEGYIDPGLHTLQIPFTLAHEMAHLYGVTNEAECNFVAYLACMETKNDFIKYSAKISFWKYLRSYSVDIDFEKEMIAPSFKEDLESIRSTMNEYPDILPAARNYIYDQYLKRNGVKSGIKSYSQFVTLLINYEK